jgi:hypothetical protein
MTDKYGPCWAELMENETQESLADLYVGQLVGIAHLEAENAALKAQVQRLSAPVATRKQRQVTCQTAPVARSTLLSSVTSRSESARRRRMRMSE